MTHASDRRAIAALFCLITLQLVMLAALYAGSPPHPPQAIALFAIAPFIGVSVSVAGAAWLLGPTSSASGRGLTLLAATLGALSFGPQKYLDPQFPLIWPAVICAQIAIVVLIVAVARASAGQRRGG